MMKPMSWIVIAVCCAFAFAPYTPAGAQQGDQSRDRGARDGGDTTIIHNYGDRGRGYGDRGRRQYYRERRPGYVYQPGFGWYDPSAVIGGAIGGWLWRQWAQPEPAPAPVQKPAPAPISGMAYCINRYKSYDANPRSPTYGTYLGYDGQRHPCP